MLFCAAMTSHEIELSEALGHCGMLPGSSMKRFARDMAHLAKTDPGAEVTLRQRHYLELLAWRFRRQLPRHLVPARKPLDLPPAKSLGRRAAAKAARAEREPVLPLFAGIGSPC